MIFIEPEVDCFCLRLRDVRVPAPVLALKPDTLAAETRPSASALPVSHRGSAQTQLGNRDAADVRRHSGNDARDGGRRSPSAACTVSSSSEQTAVSRNASSHIPHDRGSSSSNNSGVGCGGADGAPIHHDTGFTDGPSYAKISLEERADAVHRALLSTLRARFPYEAADSLEYAYVLVVTHHATMSLLRPDWSASAASGKTGDQDLEMLHRLTCNGDFQPAELRCRTFPSHLNVLLDPTSAAAAIAAEQRQQQGQEDRQHPAATPATSCPATHEGRGAVRRPSIRVTGISETDTASAATPTTATTTPTAAAPEPLQSTPAAQPVPSLVALPPPRFYDSFFLLARGLTPEQQALYYASQRLGRPVRVEASGASAVANDEPPAASSAASAMTSFSVLQGRFLHYVPTEASNAAGCPEASDSGLRRVAGESRTHLIGDRPRDTTDAASAGEARALYFSVYRIPLTRFSPAEQQYCTRQREELRWRQRRQCGASYSARHRNGRGMDRELQPQQSQQQQLPHAQRSRAVPDSKHSARGGPAATTCAWSDELDLSSTASSSSSSNSCDDSDADELAANGTAAGVQQLTKSGRDASICLHARAMWRAMEGLFTSEACTAPSANDTAAAAAATAFTGAPPALTTAEQRGAARFFRTCHEVLTNYAIAHSPYAAVLSARPSATPGSDLPDKKANTSSSAGCCGGGGSANVPTEECTSTRTQQQPVHRQHHLRRYPGVSYVGVTRLLYSLAPCDCYHLVMKDNNPLYYAHSSRAAYEPQTVPLSLVSDLSPETATSPPSGAATQEPPRSRTMGGEERVLQLTHLKAPSTRTEARRYTGVDEAAGGAAAAGAVRDTELRRTTASAPARPSPTPPLSGRVLLLGGTAPSPTPPPTAAAAAAASGLARKGPEDLVCTPCTSRAPSPDRAARTSARRTAPTTTTSTGTGARPSATHRRGGLVSATDGFLRVTTSLLCNNVSGNPKTTVKSLAEKGVHVPSFLLPDGAQGARSTCTAAHRADTDAGSSASAAVAVVNLFKALAQSSLAQHKLRYGSLRAVVSVAVLDTAPSHAGADAHGLDDGDGGDGGFTAGLSDGGSGDGTRRFGTSEATALRVSRRHVCRGLVDHTWLSIPVQHVPAEQEAIQWMPVMLGSTECVSDVGLRTAVHLGIFPVAPPNASTAPPTWGIDLGAASAASGRAAPTADVHSGVYPTREGALNSLKPSQSNWQRSTGPGRGSASTVSSSTDSDTSHQTKPAHDSDAARVTAASAPLRARDVNSAAISATPPPQQACKESATQTHPGGDTPASQPPPQPPTTVTPVRLSEHSARAEAEGAQGRPEGEPGTCTVPPSAAAPCHTAATPSPPPVTRRTSPHRSDVGSRYTTTGTTRLSAATSGWEELSIPVTAPDSDEEVGEDTRTQERAVDVDVDADVDLNHHDDDDGGGGGGARGNEEHDGVEGTAEINAAAPTSVRVAAGGLALAFDIGEQQRVRAARPPLPDAGHDASAAPPSKAPFARLAAAHPATVMARTTTGSEQMATDGARLHDATSRWGDNDAGAEVDTADAFDADTEEERLGGTRGASHSCARVAQHSSASDECFVKPSPLQFHRACSFSDGNELARALAADSDSHTDAAGWPRGGERHGSIQGSSAIGVSGGKSIQWATELRRSTPLPHTDEVPAAPYSISANSREARHPFATPDVAAASRLVHTASGACAREEEEEATRGHTYLQPSRGRVTTDPLASTSSATPFGATRRPLHVEGVSPTPPPQVHLSAFASTPLPRREEAALHADSQRYNLRPSNCLLGGGGGGGSSSNTLLGRGTVRNPFIERSATAVAASAGTTLGYGGVRQPPLLLQYHTTPPHPFPLPLRTRFSEVTANRDDWRTTTTAATSRLPPHPLYEPRPLTAEPGALQSQLSSLTAPHNDNDDDHHDKYHHQQQQQQQSQNPFTIRCQPFGQPAKAPPGSWTSLVAAPPLPRFPAAREPPVSALSISSDSATPPAQLSPSSSPWMPERFFDDGDAGTRSGATTHPTRPTHDQGRGAGMMPPVNTAAGRCNSHLEPRAGEPVAMSTATPRQAGPEAYFGMAWNARKTQQDPFASQATPLPHGTGSRDTNEVRTTLFSNAWASPSPRRAVQASDAPPEPASRAAERPGLHLPRLSFFSPHQLSRTPLTTATATAAVPRDYISAGLHTPPRAMTRQTVGTGRLSFSSPPPAPQRGAAGVAAGASDGEREARFAAAPVATNLHRSLFIDEYDDAAVAVGGLRARGTAGFDYSGADTGGTGSRVRPRGVSAMDPAWWKPAPGLSAAPNLRTTTFHDCDRLPEGRARPPPPPPRASADQPYAPPPHTTEDYREGYCCGAAAAAAAPRRGARGFGIDGVDERDAQDWGVQWTRADRTAPLPSTPHQPYNSEQGWVRPSFLQRSRLSADAGAATGYDQRDATSTLAEVSPSSLVSHRLQARTPFAMRRASESLHPLPSAASWAAPLRRRPPLAPPRTGAAGADGDVCAGSHAYTTDPINPFAFPTPRPTTNWSHTRLSLAERVRQRRLELMRHEQLAQYREHLQEHYLCGTSPKRFCYEQTRCSSGTAAAWPSHRTTAVPPAPVASLATAPVWRIGEEARNCRLGLPPPPLPRSPTPSRATAAPPGSEAATTRTRSSEEQLRQRAEQEARLEVRRQMVEVADGAGGTAASRPVTASNVGFTLRDVAAVFLRLPSTTVVHRTGGGGGGGHVTGGDGLEVLDICHAVRRTEGASCFLSRKPVRLRGGWESYLERINLYQEPFYLRDQAFVLTLPVPHVPSLKVCVAIPNVNDLLALVCHTPVPRLLPTAEEAWMRQCQYGLYDGDDEKDTAGVSGGSSEAAAPGGRDGGPAVVVEEQRRWFFGLLTTRRLVAAHTSTESNNAAAGWSSRSGGRGNAGGDGGSYGCGNSVAARHARCRQQHRQHQLDGLRFTWRHRARLWLALLRAGWTCTELPACTSPYLTDPAACTARCALVCDRLAAYAGLRHRVETLRLVRGVYLESRAKELARQRVLKLCDSSERAISHSGGTSVRLGGGGEQGGGGGGGAPTRFPATRDVTAVPRTATGPLPASSSSAWWSSRAAMDDDARVARGGVAFTQDASPRHGTTAWNAPPADASTREWARRHGGLLHAEEEREDVDGAEERRRARAGTPRPPSVLGGTSAIHGGGSAASLRHRAGVPDAHVNADDHFDAYDNASGGLYRCDATSDDPPRRVRAFENLQPHRRSTVTPPPSVSATAARRRCGFYANDADYDDHPTWCTTNTRTNATTMTMTTHPGSSREDVTLPSATTARRPGDTNHPYATGRAARTGDVVGTAMWHGGLPLLGRPATVVAATGLAPPPQRHACIAPYASGSSLTPLPTSQTETTCASSSASCSLALRTAAASAGMDLMLRVDRDDTMAAALERLTEPRSLVLTTPLQPVLSVVPLASQPVRGAGAGVGGADAAVGGTGSGRTDTVRDDAAADAAGDGAPLYPGFVPTPLEVQQRAAQPFNLSIAQAQQLLQWQWEFHQHRYTLMPVPLLCSNSSYGGAGDGCGHVNATPPVDFTHTTSFPSSVPANASAVSPLARELMLHLLRWSWLLPIDYAASRQSRRQRRTGRRGASARTVRLFSQSLRPWRGLMWLLVLVLALEHAWWCLRALILLGILHVVGNVLGVGLLFRLPSHRGGLALWSRVVGWLKFVILSAGGVCGGGPHLRRHASPGHRANAHGPPLPPRPLCVLEKDLPPLDQGVTLLYSLGEATTEAMLERRRANAVSRAVVVRVLRLQTAGAALLSRLQLFSLGYSTALSVWVLLLLLAYAGLYAGYSEGLHAVGWDSDHSASPAGARLWNRVTGHVLGERSSAALTNREGSSSSSPMSVSAAERSVALLQGLSTAAWRELLEPTRYLLGQRLRAILSEHPHDSAREEDAHHGQGEGDAGDAVVAAAAEAMAGVVQAELLRDAASTTATTASMTHPTRSSNVNDHRPQASPSYFYQNGRYYAYDAAPPAWARGITTAEEDEQPASTDGDVAAEPTTRAQKPPATTSPTPVDTHAPRPAASTTPLPPPRQDMATATPSSILSTPSAAGRFVKARLPWLSRAAGVEAASDPEAASTNRTAASSNATSATAAAVGADNASATGSCEVQGSHASGVESACAVSRDALQPPLPPRTEPRLLWFVVLAYSVTFCLPRSPFRWLWRRVCAVFLHDDALTRRPTLTV